MKVKKSCYKNIIAHSFAVSDSKTAKLWATSFWMLLLLTTFNQHNRLI